MDLQYIQFHKYTVVYGYVLHKLRVPHKNQDKDLCNVRLSKQDFLDILHLSNILGDSLVVFQYNLADKSMLVLSQLHGIWNSDHMGMEHKGFHLVVTELVVL